MTTYDDANQLQASEIYHEEIFVFQHLKKLAKERLEAEYKGHWDLYCYTPSECGKEYWPALKRCLADHFTREDGADPQVISLRYIGDQPRHSDFGFYQSDRYPVLVFRYLVYWDSDPYVVNMIACETRDDLNKFIHAVEQYQIQRHAGKWVTINGDDDEDAEINDLRDTDTPVMNENQQRLMAQIKGFFSEDTRKIYEGLKLPHRMGCLLYGPPGTGKTNFIRSLNHELQGVSFFNFRSTSCTDNDDLDSVFKTWCKNSPSVLIIEDIDVMFTHSSVTLSHFLNKLDGLSNGFNGNVIMATTNHPEKLEASVLNRPGRFDELILFGLPEDEERRRFYRARLEYESEDLEHVVELSRKLTFADMNHSLLTSGFHCVQEGRTERSLDDLRWAIGLIKDKHQEISGGFREMDGCGKFFGFCPQQDDE